MKREREDKTVRSTSSHRSITRKRTYTLRRSALTRTKRLMT